jgi:hypothetical protein
MNTTIRLSQFVRRETYISYSLLIKKMEKQHQDVDVVWFLLGLKPEYEYIPTHILGGSDLPLLLKVFSRL